MFMLREVLLVSLVAYSVTSLNIPSPSLLVKYGHLPVNFREGSYSFIYTGDDGSTLMERGHVVSSPNTRKHLSVTGTFSYKDQYGEKHMVPYQTHEPINGHRKLFMKEMYSRRSARTTTKRPRPSDNLPPAIIGSLLGGGVPPP